MIRFQREKDELRAIVNLRSFIQPAAVTLTMKKRVGGQSNDMMVASVNFRHFMNRLNHDVLKSAAKRHGKRLKVFCVIEANSEGRLHYHAIIDRPLHVGIDAFTAAVKFQWGRTDFGYREIDVQDGINDGWLSYMLKDRQKDSVLDSIDWDNCQLIAE